MSIETGTLIAVGVCAGLGGLAVGVLMALRMNKRRVREQAARLSRRGFCDAVEMVRGQTGEGAERVRRKQEPVRLPAFFEN